VEIWFSKIEREVIARGVFTSVHDLARKLMRYIRAYSKSAKPFNWKYSDVRRRVPRANEFNATAHLDVPGYLSVPVRERARGPAIVMIMAGPAASTGAACLAATRSPRIACIDERLPKCVNVADE
jgi:hypothetical protein